MARIGIGALLALAIAFFASFGAPAARAEHPSHVALVVGSAAYRHTAPLANPLNDARAMERALRGMGFVVTRVEDPTKAALQGALSSFITAASNADTALVFFAGHGMEIDGVNYLIPVDAALKSPASAALEAVRVEDVLAAIAQAARLSVVVVDACRTNSFPSGGERSGARGVLRQAPRHPGQVLAFSTEPGRIALDGAGRLSPYTAALTEALARRPSQDVRILFSSLGARVSELAGAPQEPTTTFRRLRGEHVPLVAGAKPPGAPIAASAGTPEPRGFGVVAGRLSLDPGHRLLGETKSGDRRFAIVAADAPITWPAARAAAKRAGGQLATLATKGESDAVTRLLLRTPAAFERRNVSIVRIVPVFRNVGPWIGARQTRSAFLPSKGWAWISDGAAAPEPWRFTNWTRGEPNDGYGDETVAVIYCRRNSLCATWNDANINHFASRTYLVEF